MDSEAERRFWTIHSHLTSTVAGDQYQPSLLRRGNTAGEFFQVFLPTHFSLREK